MQRRTGIWLGVTLGLLAAGYALHLRAASRATATASEASSLNHAAQARRVTAAARADAQAKALPGAEPPVFVVRGDADGGRLVFLHGMCGHGLGYAQSFQYAAAEKGILIAPQADQVCGPGPWAKWSRNVPALNERIAATFQQLGDTRELSEVCVLGVSQGATRAAELVRLFPKRYRFLVSIGAPTVVNAAGLGQLRAAVFMVGERERKDLMLESERALRRIGVPSKSVVIPDTDHADLGKEPEETMGAVLDWLWEVSRGKAPAP